MSVRSTLFVKIRILLVIGLMIWMVVLWGAVDNDFRVNLLNITGSFVFGGDYDGVPDVGCIERPALVQDPDGYIASGNVRICVWN